MSEFTTFFQVGLHHVLSIDALDHIMFLLALTIVYSFKDWKKVLILVTIFTVGHTISLFLSVFKIIQIKPSLIEQLIPITIIVTAINNLFSTKTVVKNQVSLTDIITLFFGLIHGLGFSNHIKSILNGSNVDKILPLTEFALGIEVAQIIIVLSVLTISYIIQTTFKVSKRDWILFISAVIIGIILPIIFKNKVQF